MKDYNIIEESKFEFSHGAVVKNYGEEFNPWWGWDSIELTKEDIDALLNGKVLESNCSSEYGMLIRMKPNDETTSG